MQTLWFDKLRARMRVRLGVASRRVSGLNGKDVVMKLTDEIAEGESYGLEFKLIPNEDRIKYLKTAVAFANGKGGRLLFGVANDGTVDDAGFAVRMNVYRNNTIGGEVVNTKSASKNHTGEAVNATVSATVSATVNDLIVEIVRSNPGIRRPKLLELLPTVKRGTLTRRLSDLSDVIEFRGAPKTGGYYCKK